MCVTQQTTDQAALAIDQSAAAGTVGVAPSTWANRSLVSRCRQCK